MLPKCRISLSIGRLPADAITVVMAFDDHWAPYAAATISSVCAHAGNPIQFVVLTTNLSVQNTTKFSQLIGDSSHALRIMEVDPNVTSAFTSSSLWWSNSVYLRLVSPEILDFGKAIYLDADIIVRSPLDALFNYNLDGAAIAGVVDISDRLLQAAPGLNWLNLPKGDNYINTGVLLMDLSRLRSQGFFGAALAWYNRNSSRVRLVDQCILNSVLSGQKAHLHPRWNIRQLSSPAPQFRSMLSSKLEAVFHFNGAVKPWSSGADKELYKQWIKHLPSTLFDERDCIRPVSTVDPSFMEFINTVEKAFADAKITPTVNLRDFYGV